MAPLTLAQDRLARGQGPGPSSPPPSRSRSRAKSPKKSRIPRGLLNNDGKDDRQAKPDDAEEPTPGAKENEMWEESQRRHKAAVILGSWEMVAWHAIAGDETRFLIPTVSQLTLPFTFTELLFVVRLSVLIHASILLRPQKSLISPLSLTLQSIPQTRLRLQRMMIGLPDQPGSDHWEDERNPGDDDYAHSSGKRSGSSPQNKGKRKH